MLGFFNMSRLELVILLGLPCSVVIVGAVIVVVLLTLKRNKPAAGTDLVACPDCGRPVSRLARSCPQCGRPLDPEAAP